MGMLQSVNIYSQFNKYIFAHKLGSVQNVQKYAVKHNFEINYYVIGTWVKKRLNRLVFRRNSFTFEKQRDRNLKKCLKAWSVH